MAGIVATPGFRCPDTPSGWDGAGMLRRDFTRGERWAVTGPAPVSLSLSYRV